jgi:hypothetical protein
MKMQYVAPVLEEVGSFEAVTLAVGKAGLLDKDFPRKTPDSELTFS